MRVLGVCGSSAELSEQCDFHDVFGTWKLHLHDHERISGFDKLPHYRHSLYGFVQLR